MGLKKFEIEVIGNSVLSFFPGQTVSGILHIHSNKDYKHEGITVSLEGQACVHWKKYVKVKKHGGTNSRRNSLTKVHSAVEKYFDVAFDMVGTGTEKTVLLPGHHRLPFNFKLPQGLPSSFVGKHGVVTYEIRAEVKRSWKKKQANTKVPFTVNGILDLNIEPGVSQPLEVRKYKKLCCLFCKSNPVGFVLTLPRRGFVSGESLQFTAELQNYSRRKVNGVKIALTQIVTFKADENSVSTSNIVCEAKGPAVERGDTESWSGHILKIPPLPPSRLATCRIIDVQYTLHLEMDLAGLAINLRQDIPITIGSVPLRTSYNEIRTIQNSSSQIFPSAPPEDLLDYTGPNNEPTSFLQDIYPDLPPPSYAETVFKNRFSTHGGAENIGFDGSSESNHELNSNVSAAPNMYAPKYVTYGK